MSWYRMHRGWMDDRLFHNEKYSRREAWCWLIENAHFEDTKEFVKGDCITVPCGSIIQTEKQLADIWKWSRQQVRTFLKHLKVDEKIAQNLTNGLTTISIMNYSTYQDRQPKKQPASNQPATSQQPTIKESKNLRTKEKDKPIKKVFDGVVPDEWVSWAIKAGLSRKAAETEKLNFIDYWTGNKSKEKRADWFVTWKPWIRKHREFSGEPVMNGDAVIPDEPRDEIYLHWKFHMDHWKKDGSWLAATGSPPPDHEFTNVPKRILKMYGVTK